MNNSPDFDAELIITIPSTRKYYKYDMTGKNLKELELKYQHLQCEAARYYQKKPKSSDLENQKRAKIGKELEKVLDIISERIDVLSEAEEEKRIENEVCLQGDKY